MNSLILWYIFPFSSVLTKNVLSLLQSSPRSVTILGLHYCFFLYPLPLHLSFCFSPYLILSSCIILTGCVSWNLGFWSSHTACKLQNTTVLWDGLPGCREEQIVFWEPGHSVTDWMGLMLMIMWMMLMLVTFVIDDDDDGDYDEYTLWSLPVYGYRNIRFDNPLSP